MEPALVGQRRSPSRFRPVEARDPGSVVVLGSSSVLRIAEVLAPCVAAYAGSVIVYDPTGELWRATARARSKLHGTDSVFVYSPLTRDYNRFDALAEIRMGTDHEILDALDVARSVCNPHGLAVMDSGSSADLWRKNAQAVLVAVILHVLHDARYLPDLAGVSDFLRCHRSDWPGMLQDMMSGSHDPDLRRGWRDEFGRPTATHPTVAAGAKDLLDRDSGERASILSSLFSWLAVHAQASELSRGASRRFSFSELVDGRRPCTLYLQCYPDDLETSRPLFRLLLGMIISRRTSTTDSWPRSLLIAADAFAGLGSFSALSFLSGYSISLLLAADSVASVEGAYPRSLGSPLVDATIVAALGVRDSKTAEYVSQRLERHEVPWGSQGRRSRAQLTADEILSLPDDRMILFRSGCSTVIPVVSAEPVLEPEPAPPPNAGSEIVAATSEGSVSVEEGAVVLRDAARCTVASWRTAESAVVARAVASLYVSGGLAGQAAALRE